MKNMLGIGPSGYKELSYEEHIKIIKEVGFEAVIMDPDVDIDEKCAICRKYGLYIDNIHAPFGGLNCMWYEGDDGEKYTQKIEDFIRAAARNNIPHVIIHCTAGGNPEEPHGSPVGIERFGRIIQLAKKLGVKPVFENLEYPEMLGLIFDTFKDEDIGFCWDTGHEALCTPGMRFIPMYGDRLCCTHIHDNYGASYTKVPIVHGDCHMIPFDGALDFKRIMRDIRSVGYEGVLMLECGPRDDLGTYYDLSPREYYERCFKALTELAKM